MPSHNRANLDGLMSAGKRHTVALVRFLGSTGVEVCLIVTVAIVVLVAAVLQAKHGRPYSQWFVYNTSWFISLLTLLGASLVCAIYVRWPWNLHGIALIIARAGLLLVVAGSFYNFWSRVEGQIVLTEGESTDQLALADRCQITASWIDQPHERPYVFSFESGPVDWTKGARLDIGPVDGMSARVLKYYRRGQVVETWHPDEHRDGGPLLRFRLEGASGGGRVEHFLADQDFGAELFVGPIALRLQRATSDAMLADFLNSPERELGEKGLLTMYYQDDVQQVAVDEHVGTSIKLGDSGATIELLHYLADAKLDRAGKFQPVSDKTRNPLLELRVHVPNENEPFRQVAFAKSPLLNLDGVYDRVCPVKFVYQHPKIGSSTAIEFLQSKNGKLYGRTSSGMNRKANGEVTPGSRLDIPGGFTFIVDEYLPHARRQISFEPARESVSDGEMFEPAIEVEISVAGITERVWLQRNHLEFQRRTIATPDGPLQVQFGNAQFPLGFSLRLIDCYGNPSHGRNGAGPSIVQLMDEDQEVDVQKQISSTHRIRHSGFNFYQSASREAGHGKQASVFRVVYSPGGLLKMVGTWTIFLGIVTMLCARHLCRRAAVPAGTF